MLMTTTQELVQYLDNVMKERRLSQRGLALYAGVAPSTISRVMRGYTPDYETLEKLAKYLRVDTYDLYRMAGLLPPHNETILRYQEEQIARDLASLRDSAIYEPALRAVRHVLDAILFKIDMPD